jgi:hypothetical protein
MIQLAHQGAVSIFNGGYSLWKESARAAWHGPVLDSGRLYPLLPLMLSKGRRGDRQQISRKSVELITHNQLGPDIQATSEERLQSSENGKH